MSLFCLRQVRHGAGAVHQTLLNPLLHRLLRLYTDTEPIKGAAQGDSLLSCLLLLRLALLVQQALQMQGRDTYTPGQAMEAIEVLAV